MKSEGAIKYIQNIFLTEKESSYFIASGSRWVQGNTKNISLTTLNTDIKCANETLVVPILSSRIFAKNIFSHIELLFYAWWIEIRFLNLSKTANLINIYMVITKKSPLSILRHLAFRRLSFSSFILSVQFFHYLQSILSKFIHITLYNFR